MFEQPSTKNAQLYLRVSTLDQDNANQETGVLHYAELHGFNITATHRDTITSKVPWKTRALHGVIDQMNAGETLLVSEVSRLARNTLEVLEIAAFAAVRNICIIATKNNLTFNGTLESRITQTILALAAEIEREFITSRTREAIARAKANGIRLGRPCGSGGKSKLDGREDEISKYVNMKLAKTSMAKLMGVSRGTMETKLARMQATHAEKLTGELFPPGAKADTRAAKGGAQ